jgi:hypothetical protein
MKMLVHLLPEPPAVVDRVPHVPAIGHNHATCLQKREQKWFNTYTKIPADSTESVIGD